MLAFLDNLRLSLGTFRGNPVRALLTLLGIVIGVTTVITMMALIEGLRVKVEKDMSQLGADSFKVTKWPTMNFGPVNWAKYAKRPPLQLDDARSIEENAEHVSLVAVTDDEWGQKIETAAASTRPNVTVFGGTPAVLETSGLTVDAGRFFNETEAVDGRNVAVVGRDVADALFPNMNPVGYEIRVRDRPYTVVGVLQRRGSFLGMFSLDNQVYIPLRAFQQSYGKARSLDFAVKATAAEHVKKAQEEAENILRRRRGVNPGDEDSFEVATNESMTSTFNNMSMMVSIAGFGVCLLSLVVGGIGILNIMLVSVTERTKEIGVRKALGARRSRILGQFATEAVMLSLVGGAIGVALGFFFAFLGRWMLGFPTTVPGWAVALSLVMSSGVGLLFGIYPAYRAARLDPVEAMRSE